MFDLIVFRTQINIDNLTVECCQTDENGLTDDDGNSFVSNNGMKVLGASDDFGRTTKIVTSCGEGKSVFLSEYEYKNGKSANSTTNLVSKLTHKYGSNQVLKYEYSYNGTTITYDKMGNPLSYRDGMKMTWQNGRQLASLQTGDDTITYKYDSNGLRTQKNNGSKTTSYYYDSNNNLIAMNVEGYVLYFYYDSNGNVTSFSHNANIYYYVKNLQDDVVKIIDQAGTVYASYVYDAWGNIESDSGEPILRRLNPFRYRSYVYDNETGLYYLQSRYYDPTTGRFLNADVYCDTQSGSPLSTNMFAYCENNSVTNLDVFGYKTTRIVSISPSSRYYISFGNKSLSKNLLYVI